MYNSYRSSQVLIQRQKNLSNLFKSNPEWNGAGFTGATSRYILAVERAEPPARYRQTFILMTVSVGADSEHGDEADPSR